MVMARCLLQVLQGLLTEGHGHLVAALGGVLDHQVVQGAQPCWDFIAPMLGGYIASCRARGCKAKGRRSDVPTIP